jgi:hypothetical protein
MFDGAAEVRAVAGYFDGLFHENNISSISLGNAALYVDPLLFRRALIMFF